MPGTKVPRDESCGSSRILHVARSIRLCGSPLGLPLILYSNMSIRRLSMNTKCQVACWLNDNTCQSVTPDWGHTVPTAHAHVMFVHGISPILPYSCSPVIPTLRPEFRRAHKAHLALGIEPGPRPAPCGAPSDWSRRQARPAGSPEQHCRMPPLVQPSGHLVGPGAHIEFSR